MTTVRPFSVDSGYTQLSHSVVDDIMPIVSPAEFKIIIFVLRKTRGWQKALDALSIGQIQDGTGLSKPTITNAITRLVSEGYMVKVDGSGTQPNQYGLNEFAEIPSSKNSLQQENSSSKNSLPLESSSSKNSLPLTPSSSKKFLPTIETTKKEKEKESAPPPVESKPTPPHLANMQAAQEVYPAPIQALIQAIKDITLNTNTARIAEAAYTLFGFDATPEELKRLFLGKDSWFMKEGPGAWGNSSRPNVGNVTSSILIAREWEKQHTSPTRVAETFALIQAIQAKQLQNGAMRAEVQALPVDVRKHLEAATSGNWSRINTLTPEQWQAATPKG